MFGFHNMLLKVNVSQKSFELKTLPDQVFCDKLGGRGLAIHLLLENNPPGVDPLSPENHIIFAGGPVTGTSVLGSCCHGVYTKSPQTCCYSESYSGGTAVEYMAATGFDAILVYGSADRPVWLEISEDSVIFHPAEDLWGLDTFETEDRVKAWMKENRPESKKCGVISIGPANENLVSFPVIENDYWRSADRTGAGAVMGSKNIKAITFTGKATKKLADPSLIKEFLKKIAKRSREDAGVKANACSPGGACHLRATFYKPELSGIIDPDTIDGKAAMFTEWEDRLTIFDTFILCRFYRDLYQWEELSEIIKGVTGLDFDKEGMRKVAARVLDDIGRFNLRETQAWK
jgi:aldehyde:ferredoxin oxidoreductase